MSVNHIKLVAICVIAMIVLAHCVAQTDFVSGTENRTFLQQQIDRGVLPK